MYIFKYIFFSLFSQCYIECGCLVISSGGRALVRSRSYSGTSVALHCLLKREILCHVVKGMLMTLDNSFNPHTLATLFYQWDGFYLSFK